MISEDGSSQKCLIKQTIAEEVHNESIEVKEDKAAPADTHSSSTEGPDSPAHSTSSSPLGVMIPAYPDNPEYVEEDEDKPLLPLFSVKFSEEANKDGDAIKYVINYSGHKYDDYLLHLIHFPFHF